MRRRLIFILLTISVILAGYAAGCASTGQPHMNAAADQLRSARQELQDATSDKGGHKERAIEIVDRAIAEVDAGIEFARSH